MKLPAVLFCLILLPGAPASLEGSDDVDRLRPFRENAYYWQYRGKPVFLAGGTDDDNLFQWPEDRLRSQLDSLKAAGGNYIRNTMSDRRDKGFEVYPFDRLESGKYDLSRWNEVYWERFETMLRLTGERGIVVQIEIWDRFDYSRKNWLPHPYRPANNVNYSQAESTLAADYPKHPGANVQPFFFSTPKQRDIKPVYRFQKRFVEKLLSHALRYGHVLYCIDNETSGDPAWSRHWAELIKSEAGDRDVFVTEMWDDWNLRGREHRRTIDHPELYDFVDVSQNNHKKGQVHWDNFQWVRERISARPRPINTVKTYGADGNKFGHSDRDGVERFWRHAIGGAASARFHRPDAGLGLSDKAKACIAALRKLETLVKLWEVEPANALLKGRDQNEAYLAAKKGREWVIYFPRSGAVSLELPEGETFELRWIDIATGEWGERQRLGGGAVKLAAPTDSGSVGVITPTAGGPGD